MNKSANSMNANANPLTDAGASPFTLEFLTVMCAGRRLMAYVDEQGRWHEAYRHRELPEPVQVVD